MIPKVVKKHICEELAHGKPIQQILKPPVPPKKVNGKIQYDEDGDEIPDPNWVKPDLPDWNNVVQWLKDDEVFRADYEHAMKYGAAYLADEMLMLKDRLLKDPKSAPAFKVAMEMLKTAAMWRDSKYSERTIQEIKNSVPADAEVTLARIKQLEEELGIRGDNTVDMGPVVPVKKILSPARQKQLLAAQAARRANIKARRDAKSGPKTPEA